MCFYGPGLSRGLDQTSLGDKCAPKETLKHGCNHEINSTLLRTYVFQHGIWPELDCIIYPKLRELAEFLTLAALQGKALTTAKKYAGGFSPWKKWTSTKSDITLFSAKPVHVALY